MLSIKWPKTLKKIKEWSPLAVVFLTAFALRFYFLLHRGTFWFDEVYSATYSVLPWKEFIKYAIIETNPPLYTFLLRFWINLVGQNETLIRLLPLLFGMTTITFLYFWTQKIAGRSAAFVSSLILALSGFHIYLSAENRVYGLTILLSTISFYLFFEIISNQNHKKSIAVSYFIVNLLLIYSHLTTLLVPLIQLFISFFFGEKEKWFLLVKINLITFGFWLIWAIPSFLKKFETSLGTGWFFLLNDFSFPLSLKPLLLGFWEKENIFNLLFFFLILSAVLVFLFIKIKKTFIKKERLFYCTILLWGFLPPLFASLLNNSAPKFFSYSLPAFCLMFAIVFTCLKNKNDKIVFILVLLTLLLPGAWGITNAKITDWQEVTKNFKEENSKESLIIVEPFCEELTLKRYYQGKIPIIGAYPKKDNYSLTERVARFNWQTTNTNKEELKNWISEVAENKKIIFYLTYRDQSMLTEVLKENNWHLTGVTNTKTEINQKIFEFRKNEN